MDFKVTKDHRVFLNGLEIPKCLEFQVVVAAGEDPEVVLRVSCKSVSIDGYAVRLKQTGLQKGCEDVTDGRKKDSLEVGTLRLSGSIAKINFPVVISRCVRHLPLALSKYKRQQPQQN